MMSKTKIFVPMTLQSSKGSKTLYFSRFYLFIFRDGGREGEREREKR